MHELTGKCLEWHCSKEPMAPLDSIITTYLRECDEMIRKSYCIVPGSNLAGTKNVTQILGLEEVHPVYPTVEAVKPLSEWCKHCTDMGQIVMSPAVGEWDICPVKGCHAPRPVEESLERKFRDLMAKRCVAYTELGLISNTLSISQELAKIAEEHFNRIDFLAKEKE